MSPGYGMNEDIFDLWGWGGGDGMEGECWVGGGGGVYVKVDGG